MSKLSAIFLEQNLAEPYILTPMHLLVSLIFTMCLGGSCSSLTGCATILLLTTNSLM